MKSSQKIKLFNLIAASVLIFSERAVSGPVDEWLNDFLLKDATKVVSKFGAPDISTPHQLIYTFGSSSDALSSGIPAPVINFTGPIDTGPMDGHTGSGSGVALQAPQLRGQQLPCLIEFDIDASSIVQHARYRGPGCYEIVYNRTNRD
jgi:hypothetical protein